MTAVNGPLAYLKSLDDRLEAMKRIYRSLRAGGVAIIDIPNFLQIMRSYSSESLAEDAVMGRNTIICSETGTGKTWVALHIVEKHLGVASSGIPSLI